METRFNMSWFTKITVGSLTLLLGAVFASSTFALTVSPPIAEVNLDPGVETTLQIKLFNETEDTLTLYTEVVSWSSQDTTGTPAFNLEGELIGLSSWISIQDGPIILEPSENISLPVTIPVPEDASPGGHYAAIFFSENTPDTEGGGQLAIGQKITSLILGSVEGDVEYLGSIRSISTIDGVLNRLPVDFLIRFENIGNIHLRPTGVISVTNMFGKVSDEIGVNLTKSATLPGQIREYDAIWEKNVVSSNDSGFFTEFGNEWNNFALGKYTASANLTSETDEGFLTHNAETTFWVFPWRVLLVMIVGVFILIFLIIILLSKYNQWIIRKAQEHIGSNK